MSVNSKDLETSIRLLNNSINLLSRSIEPIDEVTSDLTNYQTVLTTKTVFDVIPESAVLRKSEYLKSLVGPQIDKDFVALNDIVTKSEREKGVLKTRYETSTLELENLTSRGINGPDKDKRRLSELKAKKAELTTQLESLKKSKPLDS